jgi:hypothetical protein
VRRRLFAIFSVLSLIFLTATLVLWVRSYWRVDALERVFVTGGIRESFTLISLDGTIYVVARSEHAKAVTEGASDWKFGSEAHPGPISIFHAVRMGGREFLGFGNLASSPPQPIRWAWFPHWFPAAVFAILPTRFVFFFYGVRRTKPAPNHTVQQGSTT